MVRLKLNRDARRNTTAIAPLWGGFATLPIASIRGCHVGKRIVERVSKSVFALTRTRGDFSNASQSMCLLIFLSEAKKSANQFWAGHTHCMSQQLTQCPKLRKQFHIITIAMEFLMGSLISGLTKLFSQVIPHALQGATGAATTHNLQNPPDRGAIGN